MIIDELVEMLDLLYVEVVDINNGKKSIYGRIGDLPSSGLYINLLGTEEQVLNLNMSLVKSNIPQTWRQGNLVALAFLCNGKLFCLFYVTDKKALESVQFANRIYEKFKSVLEQTNNVQGCKEAVDASSRD